MEHFDEHGNKIDTKNEKPETDDELNPDELDIEDDDGEDTDGDHDLSDDDEPTTDAPDVEDWMKEDEHAASEVPVLTHIKMKKKLKGRIADKDDEIAVLNNKITLLEQASQTPNVDNAQEPLTRPREADFDTLQEFDAAMTAYENHLIDSRLDDRLVTNAARTNQQKVKQHISDNVDKHYTRAAKLIEENNISAEAYQAADGVVRRAIEAFHPGKGDLFADDMISLMGEGSEKVFYYLGINKAALNEFKLILADDPRGLKASVFLGQQRERLNNTKKRRSNAPPPGKNNKGDLSGTENSASLLRRRKAALKKGDIQTAYNMKKAAKAKGVDVSKW